MPSKYDVRNRRPKPEASHSPSRIASSTASIVR